MTLLRKPTSKGTGGGGPTVTTYTVATGDTINLPAALTAIPYADGSIVIGDTSNSMFVTYKVMNNSGTISSSIFGIIGFQFDVTFGDYDDATHYGPTLTNNTTNTLLVTLIAR